MLDEIFSVHVLQNCASCSSTKSHLFVLSACSIGMLLLERKKNVVFKSGGFWEASRIRGQPEQIDVYILRYIIDVGIREGLKSV